MDRFLIDQCGLPPVRLHDIRRGAASLALAASVDLKVIEEMLGHFSIVTIAEIYTGVLSEPRRSRPQRARRSFSTRHVTG
jgi:site-specific recombinase XerD